MVLDNVQSPLFKGDQGFEILPVSPMVGPVQETLPRLADDQEFSLVHLDMDLFAPTRFALDLLSPRLRKGGVLLMHDFFVPTEGYIGVYQAAQECDLTSFIGPVCMGDQSSALFIKAHN
jgi:hypothetical protein